MNEILNGNGLNKGVSQRQAAPGPEAPASAGHLEGGGTAEHVRHVPPASPLAGVRLGRESAAQEGGATAEHVRLLPSDHCWPAAYRPPVESPPTRASRPAPAGPPAATSGARASASPDGRDR